MFFFFLGQLQLLGPLEASLGDPLRIICTSPQGGAERITINEGTRQLIERISTVFTNDTVREFSLASTVKEDNGRMLACSISEILSTPVTVLIICKSLWLYL